MRKIHKNKVKIVLMTDSITGEISVSCWSGMTSRFWVKHESFIPVEIYVLDEDELYPEPLVGFAYAKGFIT